MLENKMMQSKVMTALAQTKIQIEEDRAVPINGKNRPLPYMVARTDDALTGSDNGRVGVQTTKWTVALFTAGRTPEIEDKIRAALMFFAGISGMEIERYPDGVPYQTSFIFTTKSIRKD